MFVLDSFNVISEDSRERIAKDIVRVESVVEVWDWQIEVFHLHKRKVE